MVDQVQLNFNPASLTFIGWMLATVMFGVALDLRLEHFRQVLRTPKAPMVGLFSQFLLMPAITFVLLMLLQPTPSVALGIMLVAACPGGNVSNFFTSLSGGNAALSVSMSAVSTLACVLMTPLNFSLWASLNPHTAPLLQSIHISPFDILKTVATILILPTLLGMGVAHYWPKLAQRLLKPVRILSMLILFGFIAGAMVANWQHFYQYIGIAFWVVLIVNGIGLLTGYGLAKFLGLPEADRRAVSFETGIQNSGFGLVLVFTFFGGLGGMAIVVAWWGVWHLITGLGLALTLRRFRPLPRLIG